MCDRLGPVGSRIVGEVLVGLLDLDPSSVRHAPESWTPSATIIDLLIGLDRVPVSIIPGDLADPQAKDSIGEVGRGRVRTVSDTP